MRVINNYITREVFLATIFNDGVKSFKELHTYVDDADLPIKDFDFIVKLVLLAEKLEIIYVKKRRNVAQSSLHKNVRWYMGKLEREGKIKGFTGVVGRPKGSKNPLFNISESLRRLLDN